MEYHAKIIVSFYLTKAQIFNLLITSLGGVDVCWVNVGAGAEEAWSEDLAQSDPALRVDLLNEAAEGDFFQL
ncbi:hypothetical protein LY76DRAFT_599675 [Colletotrichum caudatum]|nr:hypothetical protein LY76DRAFT_599675 [Colletotrichum caudatum]